jgi:hypothetical protein
MTARAIAGLVVYNLFLLAVGAGILWGLRGWRWWTEAVRLAGVAYLLGVASLMTLLTLELVLSIPINAVSIGASGVGLVALGVVVGRLRGHAAPGLRPPGWRFPGLTLFGALFVAGIVVYFEALFRADRLSGITREWDSWAFWMPKAKSLYFFGKLEPSFLELLPQLPSYPPGMSLIQSGAFHVMGSADTVSLHAQYWFFAAGFVAAIVGLLAGRVHQAILFPLLLLFLVSQSLVERITTVYADVPLGYLVAVAALLLVLWMTDRETWQLAATTILLSGAMLTKREGLLFAACVLVAAFVATCTEWRTLWRPLGLTALGAVALTLPWRIWFTVNGLESDGPESGYLGAFGHLDRVWPSLRLAVSALTEIDFWRVAPFVGFAAIVLAAIAGAWRASVYAATFVGLAIAGATWVTWAHTSLPIVRDDAQNPIIRVTGTPVLVLAALTPFLLERAWSQLRAGEPRPPSSATPVRDAFLWKSPWLWTIVAVGALSHPGAMLAGYSGSGLPGGAPLFLASSDCALEPVPGGRVRVVVGYTESLPEALALRAQAADAGLEQAEIAKDGCGRVRVYADGLLPAAAAQAVADLAATGTLRPTLEHDPGGDAP